MEIYIKFAVVKLFFMAIPSFLISLDYNDTDKNNGAQGLAVMW